MPRTRITAREILGGALDGTSALGLAISGGTLLMNLMWLRRPDGRLPDPAPTVSVLVPARNEARSIETCARSLLAQSYPSFEVLVLDDHSDDGTGEILARMASEQTASGAAALRVIQGAALPDGWAGKNWACHQLALAASADSKYLIFTDADTFHEPDALRRVVAEVERDGWGLLSLLPQQQVESWAERWVVPLLSLQILGFLPLPAMELHPYPALSAANGQYLLFDRSIYEKFDGHAGCAWEVAEDVTLARLVKVVGGRVRLANGAGLVRCRMYHSAPEVMAGFRRSFSGGFRIGAPIMGTMAALNVLVYIVPFLRAPFSRVARILALIIIILRTLLAWRTATPARDALTHPFGMAFLLAIQTMAMFDAFIGRKAVWKGRHIHL